MGQICVSTKAFILEVEYFNNVDFIALRSCSFISGSGLLCQGSHFRYKLNHRSISFFSLSFNFLFYVMERIYFASSYIYLFTKQILK